MTSSGKDTTEDGELPAAGDHVRSFADGEVIGKRYRIVGLIGGGGSGEVYEATDLALGEAVALKTLHPDLAANATDIERFRREVQLSRKVTHPNVCRLFDLGEHERDDGTRVRFFTMELLRGETLGDLLAFRRPMPPAAVLPIAAQIAAGLGAAHDVGVVHRDLKPGNIMLIPTAGGAGPDKVVLTDFGLARSENLEASELTATGEMVGTPLYMSPEQVRSRPVTHATDIYSFGIILYEMLSAQLPFVDKTPLAIALRRLRTPPTPLREHLPDIDPAWEVCVHRCLEVEPAKRFATAHDVLAALRGEIPSAPPAKKAGGSLAGFVRKSLGREPKAPKKK